MKHRLFLLAVVAMLCCLLCMPTALAAKGEVTFSLESGFYAETMALEIRCSVRGATIYYTLDGSIPDETDLRYDGAIPLTETTSKADPMTQVTGTTLGETYVPAQDFPSAHIIRAVAVLPNGSRTDVVSGTFFIGYDRQKLYGDMPLMLLAIDPSHLFDYDTGIYVTGRF